MLVDTSAAKKQATVILARCGVDSADSRLAALAVALCRSMPHAIEKHLCVSQAIVMTITVIC
ncbi:MAG TPA: hypothetical protein VNA69_01955 [Thermoanaerobaculia bacterium]|nr:hypothetical protein [Thermoanaerobaculia bacterium]